MSYVSLMKNWPRIASAEKVAKALPAEAPVHAPDLQVTPHALYIPRTWERDPISYLLITSIECNN